MLSAIWIGIFGGKTNEKSFKYTFNYQSIRAIIKYINFPAVELPFQLYNRCWYIPAAVLYVILRIFIDTRNITCYNKYMIRKGDT